MKFLTSMKYVNGNEFLDVALKCKKTTVDDLKKIEDSLKTVISKYDSIINKHNKSPNKSEFNKHRELLTEYYEKAPSKLNKLLKIRRNDHGLLECPYCGYPFSPDTLDHFIPKDYWPEFSIHPNNLVPQCRGCAPIKGDNYFSEDDNSALFIHPIYSDLLSKLKFKINTEFVEKNKQINFKVYLILDEDIDTQSKSRILKHLDSLKLKQRIINYCNRECTTWRNKLTSRKFNIKIALQQRLNEKSYADIAKDWKTALYQGILKNDALVNYFNSLTSGNDNKFTRSGVEIEL